MNSCFREDLCFECVRELKSQASYRNNLQETEKQLGEAFRELAKRYEYFFNKLKIILLRTHDPNRMNPFPSIQPPDEKAVWVALEHLKKFKKIALDQMENANDLGMDDDDEPIGLILFEKLYSLIHRKTVKGWGNSAG